MENTLGFVLSQRNDECAYYTQKNVQIRDWRLGTLYYIAVFCAIVYVLTDVVVLNKAFVRYTPVIGVVRLDLESPHKRNASARVRHVSEYAYCDGRPVDPTFTPITFADLAAGLAADSDGDAITAAHRLHKEQNNVGCTAMDGHGLVFPPHEEAAIFITTSIVELDQRRYVEPERLEPGGEAAPTVAEVAGAAIADTPPSPWQTASFRDAYLIGVESFVLTLGHTLFEHSSGSMAGALCPAEETAARRCIRYPRGETPEIQVKDLLEAAGLNLDADIEVDVPAPPLLNSSAPNATNATAANSTGAGAGAGAAGVARLTRRDTGLVIALMIEYSNTQHTLLPKPDPEWRMTPILMGEPAFSVDEVLSDVSDINHRILRHRSGIRIKAFQTGAIGHFSLEKLLISIASGLVIIGTARVAVNILAIYVLADRERYSAYIYEKTETRDEAERRGQWEDATKKQAVGALFVKRALSGSPDGSGPALNGSADRDHRYAKLEEGTDAAGSAKLPGLGGGGARSARSGGGTPVQPAGRGLGGTPPSSNGAPSRSGSSRGWISWGSPPWGREAERKQREEEARKEAIRLWAVHKIQKEWRSYCERLLLQQAKRIHAREREEGHAAADEADNDVSIYFASSTHASNAAPLERHEIEAQEQWALLGLPAGGGGGDADGAAAATRPSPQRGARTRVLSAGRSTTPTSRGTRARAPSAGRRALSPPQGQPMVRRPSAGVGSGYAPGRRAAQPQRRTGAR